MDSQKAAKKFPRTNAWQQYYATIIGIFFLKNCFRFSFLQCFAKVNGIILTSNDATIELFPSKFSQFISRLCIWLAKPSCTTANVEWYTTTLRTINQWRCVLVRCEHMLRWINTVDRSSRVHLHNKCLLRILIRCECWCTVFLLVCSASGTKTSCTLFKHSICLRLAADLFWKYHCLPLGCPFFDRHRWWRNWYYHSIHFANCQWQVCDKFWAKYSTRNIFDLPNAIYKKKKEI